MAFQVSRSDTGQFVLIDPATDTVIIEDDVAAGFAKLEQAATAKPPPTAAARPADPESSVFRFAGGPRYLPVLLAVVLPFVWLAVMYFALANLLSEHTLDREAAKETQKKMQELEREVQALRSEISGVPRSAKSAPKPKPKPKPKLEPEPTADSAAEPEPTPEPEPEDATADDAADEDDGREDAGPR